MSSATRLDNCGKELLPTISVVTISYNQCRYLRKCLESVASQLVTGDQYIVVDAGSRDGSRDLIDRFQRDGRVTTSIFESDNGPADGLNRGFRDASGAILAYLNSDDFLLPKTLEYVRHYFARRPEAEVLVAPVRLVDVDGRYLWRGRAPTGLSVAGVAMGRCYYVQQGTFFRSNAFRRTHGFNVENRSCWDYEMLADLLLAGARVESVMRPLGVFRIHRESISGRGDHLAMTADDRARIQAKARQALGWGAPAGRFFPRLLESADPWRRLSEVLCGFY